MLEVNGFTTVRAGEVVKIIPAPEARTKNIQTLLELERANPEDKVITQLIPLKYADPEEVKRLFTPGLQEQHHPGVCAGQYRDHHRYAVEHPAPGQILKQIDQPGTGQTISIIPLQNADAAKLVTLLTNLFKTTGPPRPKRGRPPKSSRSSWPTNARTRS